MMTELTAKVMIYLQKTKKNENFLCRIDNNSCFVMSFNMPEVNLPFLSGWA